MIENDYFGAPKPAHLGSRAQGVCGDFPLFCSFFSPFRRPVTILGAPNLLTWAPEPKGLSKDVLLFFAILAILGYAIGRFLLKMTILEAPNTKICAQIAKTASKRRNCFQNAKTSSERQNGFQKAKRHPKGQNGLQKTKRQPKRKNCLPKAKMASKRKPFPKSRGQKWLPKGENSFQQTKILPTIKNAFREENCFQKPKTSSRRQKWLPKGQKCKNCFQKGKHNVQPSKGENCFQKVKSTSKIEFAGASTFASQLHFVKIEHWVVVQGPTLSRTHQGASLRWRTLNLKP